MITIEAIRHAVAREFGVPEQFFREPAALANRKGCFINVREVSHPRQVAMALSYLLTDQSQTVIGSWFGGRDHTTVFHARQQVEKRRRSEPKLNASLRRITFDILQGAAR